MSARPTFPWRRVVGTGSGVAAACIGVLHFFIAEATFWTKVKATAVLVVIVVVVLSGPYVWRLFRYVREALRLADGLQDLLRATRAQTWLAMETNTLFGGAKLDILRLNSDETSVLALVNVGAAQGVKKAMQFEIVAIPDLELYGVVTVEQVMEEGAWCRLSSDEGKPSFEQQMRNRLAAGEVLPPKGYQVRPYMSNSYRFVLQSLVENEALGSQSAFVARREEDGRAN